MSRFLLKTSLEVSDLLQNIAIYGQFEVQHKGGKYLCLFAGGRKSSIVGDRFDTIPIPQLSQHCTGWRSAAVFVVCFT